MPYSVIYRIESVKKQSVFSHYWLIAVLRILPEHKLKVKPDCRCAMIEGFLPSKKLR